MPLLVKERMSKTFVLLEGTLAPSEARKQLSTGGYGIILDPNGMPAVLVVAEDLEQAAERGAPSLLHPFAGLPPTVIVGSDIELQDLIQSGTLTLFDLGARGAVVLGDKGVVGVLPTEVVDEYLGGGEYELPTRTMGPSAAIGDTELAGSHQTPLGTVVCVALVDTHPCGYRNKVVFLDEAHMPRCQNPDLPPHTLEIISKQ